MTTISPPPTPEPAADQAKLLIEQARRRQRRRRAITACVLVAVAAAGAWLAYDRTATGRSAGGGPEGGGSPISRVLRASRTSLLMWPVGYPVFTPTGGPPAYVQSAAGRVLRQPPQMAAGDYQPYLVVTGDALVYVGDGTSVIPDDLDGRPRVLGRSPFFAPSAAPGQVWIEQPPGPGAETVHEMAVNGEAGRSVTLPAGATLIAGTDAGLLLRRVGGRLALWRPGGQPAPLPGNPLWENGVDVGAGEIAYGRNCTTQTTRADARSEPSAAYVLCRSLDALDLRTGSLRAYPAPAGTAGWVPPGFDMTQALSPDGSLLAAYAAHRPLGRGRTTLYTVPLTGRGGPRHVPGSNTPLFARTAWSTRDGWLFYQRGRRLWAYQPGSGRAVGSSTPCCHYTVMATYETSRRPAAGR